MFHKTEKSIKRSINQTTPEEVIEFPPLKKPCHGNKILKRSSK